MRVRSRSGRLTFAVTLAGVLSVAALASAQRSRGFFGLGGYGDPPISNAKYDGQFTFVRLPSWAHGFQLGYYRADDNLMRIMDEITSVRPRVDKTNVIDISDDELMKYPVSFMTEAGYWNLDDKGAAAFGAYLKKGGFVIFDDFRDPPRGGGGWDQFATNMKRILPDSQIVELKPTDPIFHCFFDIDTFAIIPQAYDLAQPYIAGIYEDNNPKKRLMAIINYNTDVSQYWQFSADGDLPVDQSNEAFKLGVNYVIYGLTH